MAAQPPPANRQRQAPHDDAATFVLRKIVPFLGAYIDPATLGALLKAFPRESIGIEFSATYGPNPVRRMFDVYFAVLAQYMTKTSHRPTTAKEVMAEAVETVDERARLAFVTLGQVVGNPHTPRHVCASALDSMYALVRKYARDDTNAVRTWRRLWCVRLRAVMADYNADDTRRPTMGMRHTHTLLGAVLANDRVRVLRMPEVRIGVGIKPTMNLAHPRRAQITTLSHMTSHAVQLYAPRCTAYLVHLMCCRDCEWRREKPNAAWALRKCHEFIGDFTTNLTHEFATPERCHATFKLIAPPADVREPTHSELLAAARELSPDKLNAELDKLAANPINVAKFFEARALGLLATFAQTPFSGHFRADFTSQYLRVLLYERNHARRTLHGALHHLRTCAVHARCDYARHGLQRVDWDRSPASEGFWALYRLVELVYNHTMPRE